VGARGRIKPKLQLQVCCVCLVTCSSCSSDSQSVISEYFWSVHAIRSRRSSMFTMFANEKHDLASVRSWLSHCILQTLLLRLRAAETYLIFDAQFNFVKSEIFFN
jgi:hypothetical protein